MKKTLFLLIMILSVVVLASCQSECTPSAKWASDETGHWHPCSITGCSIKFEEEEHLFGEWSLSEEPSDDFAGNKERTCSICGYVEIVEIEEDEHFHSYSTDWSKDEENHWYECSCGDKSEVSKHNWNDGIIFKPATETEPGEKAYECKDCGQQKIVEVDINGHSHSYGTIWQNDENSHWNECSCGEKENIANHEFGSWNVVSGSDEEKRSCNVCGYKETRELTSVWDGVAVSTSLAGSGTEANPYLIQSAADFIYFKEVSSTMTGKYIKLMANIDLNENALIIPSFGGIFDGNNKTIFGLDNNGDAIGWPGEGDSKGTGLFHILENTGTIKNLTLKGFVQSWTTTGGFVGISYGRIENCVNYANVDCKYASGGIAAIAESGSIINCVNYGNMTGGYENNAGIVGVSRATITGCTNYGNIDSPNNGTKIGGIAGFAQYAITDCVNYGTITATGGAIGGIVGEVQGTVENCVNNAEATVSGGGWSVGGIVGHSAGNVISCKNYASVTGTNGGVAGIVGELVRDKNTKAENCENHGVVTGKQVTGGIVGYLRNNSVINCVNKGAVTATGERIGGVAGGSDVTGANITGSENHGEVKGGKHTGGIVGHIQGSVTDCKNYGNVTGGSESSSIFGKLWVPAENPATVENCENYGNVKISGWAGGLFGNAANVTIKNCVNKGNLEATSGSVGGIIGYVFAGATLTDCVNYGKITAPTNVCGVVFYVNGTLTNCDNYGELVVTNVDGVIQPIYNQIDASGSVNNCNDKRTQ